jgi:hypothetical protein
MTRRIAVVASPLWTDGWGWSWFDAANPSLPPLTSLSRGRRGNVDRLQTRSPASASVELDLRWWVPALRR